MPSPALQKLDVLPITPLSSRPGSPDGSRDAAADREAGGSAGPGPGAGSRESKSRRSSSSSSSGPSTARRGSSGAGVASSYFTAPNASASLAALTQIRNLNKQRQSAAAGANGAGSGATDGSGEIEEAVEEEDETMGLLRTGNSKLRRGSEKLRRMSSTLGEGRMAHHTFSQPHSQQPSRASTPSLSKAASPTGTRSPANGQQPAARASRAQEDEGALPSPSLSQPVHAPALADKLRDHVESTSAAAASLPPAAGPAPGPISEHEAQGLPKLSPIEYSKRLAAYRAVDTHIKPHHRVIGIGSGSTVPYVVDRILELGPEANEKRWFVPTGFQSKELIINAGLKLGDVDQFPGIDVTIDGADDVDLALNAIKGGGACHLREKVLAEAAEEFVMVADYRKNSRLLGEAWKQGIPIETPPFAYSKVLANLQRIPGCIKPTLRMGKAKAGPLVTDNGNFVIDAPFDAAHMREPEALLMKIKMLTGVVEVGLFCRMAKAAYFGNEDGSVTVRWADGQSETLQEGQVASIGPGDVDPAKNPADQLLELDVGEEPEAATEQSATGLSSLPNKLAERLGKLTTQS